MSQSMQSPSESQDHFLERWGVIFSFGVTFVFIVWVMWICRFGFDFTDEGLYLNWISSPFRYSASTSQFGFVYHPLFVLVGGSVALLRQANFLLSFGLAWLLAWLLLGLNASHLSMVSGRVRFAVSAALATSVSLSCVFAGLWLPTPSYNTLTLQGILVVAIGLVLSGPALTRESFLGWILIGVGGWLTFMGKPTSAVLLAGLIFLFLLVSFRIRLLPVVVSLSTAATLLFLSAALIDGSVELFVARLREGVRLGEILVGALSVSSLFRLEDLQLSTPPLSHAALSTFLTIFVAVVFAYFRRKQFGFLSSLAPFLIAGPFLFLLLQSLSVFTIPGTRRGLLILAIPFAITLAVVLSSRFRVVCLVGWSNLLLFLLFLTFPYVYAFGSGNDYWIPIACAAIFAVLAPSLLLVTSEGGERRTAVLLTAAFAVQVATALVAYWGTLTPYRQPNPLQQNDSEISVGDHDSKLVLAKNHAEYLTAGKRLVEAGGFAAGTPMIDLTGHSPGVLYALGANSVGLAWSLGGYPGSDRFVVESLAKVSCAELVGAWILTEPRGVRPISALVLDSFAANLAQDYRLVGGVTSPDGQQQFFHAPMREMEGAKEACISRRKNL